MKDPAQDMKVRPEPTYRIVSGRSPGVIDALKAAGIITDADRAYRVVIDIGVRDAVKVTVYRYGDSRVQDVIRAMDGSWKPNLQQTQEST